MVFFLRSDLTEEQRALRPRGLAGSRLAAGWYYSVAGRRRRAWRMLFQAMRIRPSLVLKTRAGRRLLLRLFMPIGWKPYRWRSLKRKLSRALALG